jgi:hypothetical protein
LLFRPAFCGGVLAVLGGEVFDLAGGDLGDHDGVAAGVGAALFVFWTSSRLLKNSAAFANEA